MFYSNRVNFLKYQKPEKDLTFIKNSDVYKLIHDQDAPKSGIELRPELVLAEEDVRKCVSPCWRNPTLEFVHIVLPQMIPNSLDWVAFAKFSEPTIFTERYDWSDVISLVISDRTAKQRLFVDLRILILGTTFQHPFPRQNPLHIHS